MTIAMVGYHPLMVSSWSGRTMAPHALPSAAVALEYASFRASLSKKAMAGRPFTVMMSVY